MSNEQRTVERFCLRWEPVGATPAEWKARDYMDDDPEGEWVRFEDYERLEKEISDLNRLPVFKRYKEQEELIAKLQAENAALKAALSSLYQALRGRHHGRMPDEVQTAYDAAGAALAAQVKPND